MRYRRRQSVVLFTMFALLFQQLAMAAYVCAREAQAVSEASTRACHSDADTDRSRCREHCHPTSAVADRASPLTVPPGVVPASMLLVVDPPRSLAASARPTPHPWATAPPLNVQYCSLQI